MKILRSSMAVVGLLSGSLLIQAQSAGGGGGAAGGGAAGASAAAGAAGAGQAGASSGIASPGVGGVGNRQGGIAEGQPANTVAGQQPGVGNRAADGRTLGAGQQVPFNALPVQVQSAVRSRAGGTAPSSITQQMTGSGPVYTVTTLQNGTPVQYQISPTGQVLTTPQTAVPSNAQQAGLANPGVAGATPQTSGLGVTPQTSGLGNVGAGLPVSALPAQVQAGIRSQLGNAQVQTVSQDQLGTGNLYRVTALQNGVPVEYQFAANGQLLGTSQVTPGAATSAFTPGIVGTLPGTQVVLDDVPEAARNAIQERVGDNQITQLRTQQTPNGDVFWVAYDQDGRPIRMMVNADGTIRTNMTTMAATARAGQRDENNITLEELPEAVHSTLEQEAPLAQIVSIQRDQRPTGEVYRISFRGEDDRFTVLTVDAQGEVIQDSRNIPMVAIGEATPKPAPEDDLGLRFERLPQAVKTAVKAYAAEGDIRNVNLTRDRNDTVFSIVFMRDGRRDRMLVSKAGDLIRIEEDVSPALINDYARPMELAIGDLPPAVRDTIRRQTDQVMVDDIKADLVGNQTVYRVLYRTNNAPVELLVGTDGAIILPIGNLEGAGAARPAPAPTTEESPVRRVDVSAVPERANNIGTGLPATREIGGETEKKSQRANSDGPSSVNLKDVPVQVQTTAKKVAGDAVIKSIVPKLEGGQIVYAVTLEQNGRENVVRIDKSGQLQANQSPKE